MLDFDESSVFFATTTFFQTPPLHDLDMRILIASPTTSG
jgi:hypothetical protein